MVMLWLLAIVPVAIALKVLVHAPPLLVFVTGGVAIAVLAEWMRRATEQIAARAGPAIGGLLNVSFGSAAELILMVFVVAGGNVDVVRAQITGSIIGTSLLGLGLACLVGGLPREKQAFSRDRAGHLSSLLLIVALALLLPAVFDQADSTRGVAAGARKASEGNLSLGVAGVLLALYAGNLIFTLITHRDVFAVAEGEQEPASWSLVKSLGVLLGATAAVAACADLVSGSLSAAASVLHLPLLFLGVVPLALIGTASDLFAGVSFARQNRMDLVMTILIGSTIQVGLVIAPLLVVISWLIGAPMTLVFPSLLDLLAIAAAVFIVNAIAADGKTTWFEGLLLIGVYVLLALAFFFVAPSPGH
jgi:Ca2+:H+ antiporter